MPSVADCLRQHAPQYLAQFGDRIPLAHRKVLSAITRCRTGELGGVLYQCEDCQRQHWVGRSCGNRHCPCCGHDKTARWLQRQSQRRLPVHHFLVTFTVPDALRPVLRAHQQDGYRALFTAGSQTISALAGSSKALAGCQLGFWGMLHTWGRDPCIYHPHVHFVVPGGGVTADGSQWQQTPANFLFPHAAAVKVYKAKLADALRECGLYRLVPSAAWLKRFVVDIRPVGDGQAVVKYLAPYVNRVAISDRRLIACDEDSVTYHYTPSGDRRAHTRQVSGTEFVRGFLQHTLPANFQKLRYYGWLSANSRTSFEEVKWLVWLYLGWTFWLASGCAGDESPPEPQRPRCGVCGGALQIVAVTHEPCGALLEYCTAYRDSG